jgi:hypothetical protein
MKRLGAIVVILLSFACLGMQFTDTGGFPPGQALPNDATKYLDGTGHFTVPSATSSGSVNAPTEAGNPGYFPTGGASLSGIPHIIHLGPSGTNLIEAAVTACPANGVCDIIGDPGQTYTENSSSTVQIGAGTTAQTLILDGAGVTCAYTGGGIDCLDSCKNGRVVGTSWNKNSPTQGATIIGTSTASYNALLGTCHSASQTQFDVEGPLTVNFASTTALSVAAVDLDGCGGYCMVSHIQVNGAITGGTDFLIEDASEGVSALVMSDVGIANGGSTATIAYGMRLTANTHGVGTVFCYFCGVSDFTNSTAYVSVDAQSTNYPANIAFYGFYVEVKQTGGVLLDLNGVRDVIFDNIFFNKSTGGAATTCAQIENNVHHGMIRLTGRATGTTVCTNVINNIATGYTNTTLGDFDYHFNPTGNSTPVTFDGQPINSVSGYQTNGASAVEAAITDSGLLGGLTSTAAVTLLQSCTKALNAGHFTNLNCVNDLNGGACTTAPTFSIRDNTTPANGTAQTCGTTAGEVDQAETLAFAAGDVICITRTINGGTCTAPTFTVTAQYKEP